MCSIEWAFAQHHGGEQAPPISFGSGEVTVFSEIFPEDFDPEINSSADLRIRFFDTTTGINIENVTFRVKIFYEYSLVANQMFFDKDGLLEVKVTPKLTCDQEELWRCTRYHGENDPVVPNALSSSLLSKPVISGPVFDKSGEYTLEVSIIGAKNPKTQTTQDITFQTKIIIPSIQKFEVVSNEKSYSVVVKNFQDQLSDLEFDASAKKFILQIPFEWEHFDHIDNIKTTVEIPKDFPPFRNINDISAGVNGAKISTKAIHFDDYSKKDSNLIHIFLAKDEIETIKEDENGLKIELEPNPESSKIKKEIFFENGFKAKISHDSGYVQDGESIFTISFFDHNDDIVPNVRYGYSIKGPDGKEIVNTGSNSGLLGINLPSGSERRLLKTNFAGMYEIKLVLIGKDTKNFDEFLFEQYNFELTDSSSLKPEIPEWIKNNARWWAEGQIDDKSFVQGIQFMVKNKIISIPKTNEGSQEASEDIPGWIKNNARWWAEGQIDENSFIQGIQHLIKIGLIKVN